MDEFRDLIAASRSAMAKHIHELKELIATSRSAATSSSSEKLLLETKFRGILSSLLHDYVVPSSSAVMYQSGNERDVNSVLKLLSYVARNYPGVFYNGQAAAVLPVVDRVLPFLAEPAFSSRHGDIFETITSLLSLLGTGEPEVYRQFFLDAMDLV